MGAGSRLAQLDDINYTEQPFSTFDLVANQHDYEFKEDDDGNAITDITAVMVQAENSTDFVLLMRMTVNDADAELVKSPNASATGGTPTRFLEMNNTVFFDPFPNYNKTGGGKLFYKRTPSYFVIGDTTKEPGIIPANFHEMLAIAASYDWLLVNKSNARTLISRVEMELEKMEGLFDTFVRMRNPQKGGLRPRYENNR